jgi:hypothetical protein
VPIYPTEKIALVKIPGKGLILIIGEGHTNNT